MSLILKEEVHFGFTHHLLKVVLFSLAYQCKRLVCAVIRPVKSITDLPLKVARDGCLSLKELHVLFV